ncbi:SWPV1-174 [Shearwaterpox virus]|uniref:SWPV1-174 n=1 Tax=Shearwaterpox virus TaxID=1974596 RepID=A0A1V0S803_CNPV|nr:SWPV1-174 [Shearwaterpox virus]
MNTIKFTKCIEISLYILVIFTSILIIHNILDKKECYNKDPCDSGWIGIGKKCYYYSYALANWTESLHKCRIVGTELVTYPLDPNMEYFITQYSCFDKHWVGAYKIGLRTYNLELVEKISPSRYDDCFYIHKGISTSQGNNVFKCNVTIHWICEKNMISC